MEISRLELQVENQRGDRERTMKIFSQLAELMKLDKINLDLGYDMVEETLIERVRQLCRNEFNISVDQNNQIYTLRRKVKQNKEQLESKELHIEMLRKKLASVEDKLNNKSITERERDEEALQVRRLNRQCDKLQTELQKLQEENLKLKADLHDSHCEGVSSNEKQKQIKELEVNLQNLESIRQKQAVKIEKLTDEIHSRCQDTTTSMESLHAELMSLRNSIFELKQREKQLLQFRTYVALSLGLDANLIPLNDCEITRRLDVALNGGRSIKPQLYTKYDLSELNANNTDYFCHGGCNNTMMNGAGSMGNISKYHHSRSISPMKTDKRKY